MVDLLERKLIFVTGKGGVGKTSIAAALAWLAASRGRRTLVCEVDAKGNLADFFETAPIRFEEREIAPGLWAMSMDTEASLKQYLSLQLRLPLVARVGPLAKMFDFVATAAPGVKEIVTVGKLCWEVKARHYDLVVVDSSASGHIVGPAGRTPGHQPAGAGGAGPPADGVDARHPRRSGPDRPGGGGHARPRCR